ncbi:SDR family NAD(P)-dependent oxidoreductase [Amycolatopsis rubida]|uniref:Short-chain dehydrogenase n=1 Tax=Amycolatopsis rubida TaxID=112413 RepID=A0A1I5TMT4_9PSEU|nr:SDR family NAD(P)-dependent oxidoreductase [Amycolatopsis rubida]SFP84369.1 Short-chain dehydrogenase [Amycolatopsis rubida]
MTTVRTALVTGANRGLGRATAARMHGLGLRVVVAARDAQAAETAAAELGRGARAVELAVTDDSSVRRAREQVGPVDILVNNAGVLEDYGLDPLTVPIGLVEHHLAVNALGAWRVSQAFVPDMVERGWGRVVMVSSGTGAFSNGLFSGAPAYSVSKAALNGLTQMLAQHTEGTGVLVNAVNPGLVRTRMRPDAPRTAEDASADVVHAATLPDGGPSGSFLRGARLLDW